MRREKKTRVRMKKRKEISEGDKEFETIRYLIFNIANISPPATNLLLAVGSWQKLPGGRVEGSMRNGFSYARTQPASQPANQSGVKK